MDKPSLPKEVYSEAYSTFFRTIFDSPNLSFKIFKILEHDLTRKNTSQSPSAGDNTSQSPSAGDNISPNPSAGGTASPSAGGTASPSAGGTASPSAGGTPSPSAGGTPSPSAGGTPSSKPSAGDTSSQTSSSPDVRPPDGEVTQFSEALLDVALREHYSVVTRFVPPYCSTVTFYKNTVGFVTVSSLNPDFNPNVKEVKLGPKSPKRGDVQTKTKTKFISIGAINTLAQAYHDAKQVKDSASRDQIIDGPRDKKAHEMALKRRIQLEKEDKDHDETSRTLANDEIFIRLEGRSREKSAKTIMKYRPTGYCCQSIKRVWQVLSEFIRVRMIHRFLVRSKVSFQQGPAAMRNDYIYNMHNGDYTKWVRIIDGELSGYLNTLGQAVAIFNLNASIAIISALVALFTLGINGTAGTKHTGLIVSGSLVLGFRLLQMFWTSLITVTTYESIENQDFRVRNIKQAATLFGLNRHYLQLFLAILSPEQDIKACGVDNSYLCIARPGVLEISDKTLARILYFAGYITSSADPERSTIAAWVPFETRLITYPSNKKIRRMLVDDDSIFLSRLGRLEWTEGTESRTPGTGRPRTSNHQQQETPSKESHQESHQEEPSPRTSNHQKQETPSGETTALTFDHGGDTLELPEKLWIYGENNKYFMR